MERKEAWGRKGRGVCGRTAGLDLLAFAAVNKIDLEVKIFIPFWVETAVHHSCFVFALKRGTSAAGTEGSGEKEGARGRLMGGRGGGNRSISIPHHA